MLPLGASREQLHNAKRALFSRCMVDAKPGLRISYLQGIEEHVAAGKDHHRLVHFPTKQEGDWLYYTIHAGQRAAKTMIGSMEGLAAMGLPGTRGWITCPNYELTDRSFEYFWEFIVRQNCFGVEPVKKSRTRDNRYIEMPWGSWVKGKSAEAPDSLVGEQLDWEINDEAARFGEAIWLENLEQRLINRKGWAIFSSTPRGYTWFRNYAQRASDPVLHAAGWRDLNFHTADNIYIDREWLEGKRRTTPRNVWLQEYEGQFVAFSGLIFPDFVDKPYNPDRPGAGGHLWDPDGDWRPPGLERAIWVRGIDIGTRNPTGCVWVAILPSHDVVVMKDYQEVHPSHDEHARRIAAATDVPISWSVISHEAARKDQTEISRGTSALDVYRDTGIYARQCVKDWDGGISSINAYLRSTLEDKPLHPRLWISTRCVQLRPALMEYVFEERKSMRDVDLPEKPRKLNDHLCDATRFVLYNKPRYEPRWIERSVELDLAKRDARELAGSTWAYEQSQRRRRGRRRSSVQAAGRRH